MIDNQDNKSLKSVTHIMRLRVLQQGQEEGRHEINLSWDVCLCLVVENIYLSSHTYSHLNIKQAAICMQFLLHIVYLHRSRITTALNWKIVILDYTCRMAFSYIIQLFSIKITSFIIPFYSTIIHMYVYQYVHNSCIRAASSILISAIVAHT